MIESRKQLLVELCTELGRYRVAHTLRVCIDGPDAAGKTTLANGLATRLRDSRAVIRLSND